MPTHLTCPQGHRWSPGADGATSPDDPAVCPVCGAVVPLPAGTEAATSTRAAPGPVTAADMPTTPEAGPADLPGPRVPGYEILGELGRGGMGVVYQARQARPNRLVALKMVLAGAHADPSELRRFEQEAEAAARLQHPHLVHIHEVGDVGGCPYFSMELVAGGNLADALRTGPWPVPKAAAFLEVLARAVQYVHEQGIVHRDLKPTNVLLTPDGAPKISDFGVAKLMNGQGQVRTESGVVVGTPSYMAPEQAGGRGKDAGPAADVYALGAILYECLTGRPPFKGATREDTLEQVRTREPVPPSRLQPQVPPALEAVCLKCLEKDPARRYASARALAEDVRRFLAGGPVHARPAGRAERLGRWCRRNPTLAALGGLLAACLVGLLAMAGSYTLYQARAVRQLRREQGRTREALGAAERHLGQSRRLSAALMLDRGLERCEAGDPAHGLLWLARALELAPADADDFRWAARANLAGWAARPHALREVLPHGDNVGGVAFSPDGCLAATACWDGKARLWDVATGRPYGEPLPHKGPVRALAFSPDGRTLLTGGADDQGGVAWLWDVATGRPLRPEPLRQRQQVRTVAFSPDGGTALTAGIDGDAWLWDWRAGRRGRCFRHGKQVHVAAFSPDGRLVVTGGEDRLVRLWDVETGRQRHALDAGHSGTRAVAFNPADGRVLVTATLDERARFWDTATGQERGGHLVYSGGIEALAFGPAGRLLLVGGTDGTAQLFRADSGERVGPPVHHEAAVQAVAFRGDGALLLTGSLDHTARLWAVAPPPPAARPLGPPARHTAVALSPDRRTLLTAAVNRTAGLWDVGGPAPALRVSFRLPAEAISAAFGPDGKTLVLGYTDGTAQFWDAGSGRPLGPPLPPHEAVWAVALSPDGRLALTGGDEGKGRLWEVRGGEATLLRPLLPPPQDYLVRVRTAAFSPDGRLALTGNTDGTARLWEVATGRQVGRLRHRAEVAAVAFRPDGRAVLTGGLDRAARLWDVATGQPLGPPLAHPGPVEAVAFSPDGRLVLTGDTAGAVRCWQAATARPVGPPLRSDDWGDKGVVAFSANGRAALASRGAAFCSWPVPAPAEGGTERLLLWVQVLTGVGPDGESSTVLGASAWRQQRQRLRELGGPPP